MCERNQLRGVGVVWVGVGVCWFFAVSRLEAFCQLPLNFRSKTLFLPSRRRMAHRLLELVPVSMLARRRYGRRRGRQRGQGGGGWM